ncbi:uncharacterized protein Z518_00311 [Rhinocladiella mackenziei CBS 650.93]|uniref:aldehyde dehydrogenase (NAD(+)) n=1 Tax=Rhinocladiella mackenziei CBS 650.93 TaxID=1442369 RepID=A0A0D2G3P6_9EURO|nr:uncharacterized protein Z518_00311 [Rhinocladiella mackenziei CBS 650.93]KIX09232.1 hypothetical protein Z518_00311 [Rhinocladiella mackenziei CBS 650.93]
MSYIEDGRRSVAKLLHGVTRYGSRGYFIKPTIFYGYYRRHEDCARGDFWAGVAISKFSTEDDVVKKCNDTQYGLAAVLFTENVRHAHIVARKL